jgi:hypothetical protein
VGHVIQGGGQSLDGVGAGRSSADPTVPSSSQTARTPNKAVRKSSPGQAVPAAPKGAPNVFYWKLQPDGNPNHCEGRPRVITRWPTILNRKYGVGKGNSYVLADGTRMDFYAIDRDGGGAKPSYAVCDKFGRDFSPDTVVILFKNGRPFANVTVPDPRASWKVPGSQVKIFADLWQ